MCFAFLIASFKRCFYKHEDLTPTHYKIHNFDKSVLILDIICLCVLLSSLCPY